MSIPAFVLRPGYPEECICTGCFLTIYVTPAACTLEEAQKQHQCHGIDLKAMQRQVA